MTTKIPLQSPAVCLVLALCWRAQAETEGQPAVTAPFKQLDTLCVNDWWHRQTSPIVNLRVPRDQVVAFGIYTVANGTLKLSAQLYPLYPDETRAVRLELQEGETGSRLTSSSLKRTPWRS